MRLKKSLSSTAVLVAIMLAAIPLAFVIGGCAAQQGSSQASTSAASAASDAGPGQVPNVVQLEKIDAEQLLTNSGYKVGNITMEYSDSVAENHVISQSPEALASAASGTAVDMVVSKGKKNRASVSVPSVVGKTQEEAKKALAAVKLVPVPASPVTSSDVAPGLVCKQSVEAGKQVKEGDQITFSVSLGEATVTVPDVSGKVFEDAKAELQKAGLGVDTSTSYSSTVPVNTVVSQSVAAGAVVTAGTTVNLNVSLGRVPAGKVKVPDLLCYELDDAIRALSSAGLDYRYSGESTGIVVYQNPKAGTEVDPGTTVTMTLQDYRSLVAVPYIIGMTVAEAAQAYEAVGLVLHYDTKYSNVIVKQVDVTAGAQVEVGYTVNVVVTENGEAEVKKDSSAGGDSGGAAAPQQEQPAESDNATTRDADGDGAGDAAGSDVGKDSQADNESGAEVSAQAASAGATEPAADEGEGSEAAESANADANDNAESEGEAGGAAAAGAGAENQEAGDGGSDASDPSAGNEMVEVPDVEGMTGAEAASKLAEVGLVLHYDTNEADRVVADTDPSAGTQVEKGSTVDAIYSNAGDESLAASDDAADDDSADDNGDDSADDNGDADDGGDDSAGDADDGGGDVVEPSNDDDDEGGDADGDDER